MFKNYFYYLLISLLMYSCASTRIVKPLEKGRFVVGASLAAPHVIYPIPLVSLYGAYGVSNKISIYSGVNLISAVFKNLHIDFGSTVGVLNQKKIIPGISITPNFNFIYGFTFGDFRMYPELNVNLFWEYGKKIENDKKFMSYINIMNFFDIYVNEKNIKGGNLWLPSLSIGQQFNRKKFVYNIELKYLFMNQPNTNTIFEYLTKPGYGTLGIYFGVAYKFNLKNKN